MQVVTVKGLTLQFDAPDDVNPFEYAKKACDLINIALQRVPYNLCAQIMNYQEITPAQVSAEPADY